MSAIPVIKYVCGHRFTYIQIFLRWNWRINPFMPGDLPDLHVSYGPFILSKLTLESSIHLKNM